MNNNGLYIKEFEARGENVSTSKLTFQKGCNVVYILFTDSVLFGSS